VLNDFYRKDQVRLRHPIPEGLFRFFWPIEIGMDKVGATAPKCFPLLIHSDYKISSIPKPLSQSPFSTAQIKN
jgi:hypothetical protein